MPALDRGKVMSAEELEAGKEFGRYLDVDGDAIPYRTLPGTHPDKGAYFTRGTATTVMPATGRRRHYVDVMQRLLKKFETAKTLVPNLARQAKEKAKYGVIYYGSTSAAMDEALDHFDNQGLHLDALRVRAFPFCERSGEFIRAHERCSWSSRTATPNCGK